MFKWNQAFAVASVVALASSVNAFEVDDIVYPKNFSGRLKVESRVVAQVEGIKFYLRVVNAQGDWLWVERKDLFDSKTPGPVGWIRARDVMSLDQSVGEYYRQYYSGFQSSNELDKLYAVLGLVYFRSYREEDNLKAAAYFGRAIASAPSKACYYYLRSLAYFYADRYEAALADAEQAARLETDDKDYAEWLAEVRASEPAPPAAEGELEAAPAADDDSLNALLDGASEADGKTS
jgi:tetratricopeptide (TPR) repeat protein